MKRIDKKQEKTKPIIKICRVLLKILVTFIIALFFLSALSAYIKLKPPFSIPFVPLRMFLQISMGLQMLILIVTIFIFCALLIKSKIQRNQLPKAFIVIIFLIPILFMETGNYVQINNAKASVSNMNYIIDSHGYKKNHYHLSLKESYAEEFKMEQCEIYQDALSEYKGTCLIYLNYGGWNIQTKNFGAQIKKFCQKEGYTFIRFGVSREGNENILILTQKINERLIKLFEKEIYDKVILCGGSAGGHLALLCGGKKNGDEKFSVPEINVDGIVALYPCVDPGYAYDYYVNSDSKMLASQTKNLDEKVFGIRGDSNSLYDVTSIHNAMEKKIPMLIVHGINDSMMPIESSVDLYNDLSKRGYPISLLKLPGTEHVFDTVSSVAWKRCSKEMTGFIREAV